MWHGDCKDGDPCSITNGSLYPPGTASGLFSRMPSQKVRPVRSVLQDREGGSFSRATTAGFSVVGSVGHSCVPAQSVRHLSLVQRPVAPGVTSREAGHVDHGKKTDEISLFPLKMPTREPQPSQTQVTTTLK